ncbi:hypothetical protein [Sporosarcina sp. G11-34]|uniref:hypothetical protein n=1 Tax=Sporosarcina sp. G11-34 TaxID=2849605 RepID=UPI0022A94D82|nr:hypothetical protein [Sporosarcina sp. G11-34]MCZ2259992.1 hypothetical protein [Sporosarcina sp. G11-34]
MASVQTSIAIMVLSLLMGFLSFYSLSNLPKKIKKIYMEELMSQLTNFVIFMWGSKIILNFLVFINDPLAILAYPGDSKSFYLAVLFTIVTTGVKAKRKKIDIATFFTAFIFLFLTTSFVYEFIQVVWNKNTYFVNYLGLLAVLIVALVIMRDRIVEDRLSVIIFISWTVGTLVLAVTMPLMMILGYTILPWFLVLLLLFTLLMNVIYKRRKVI